MTALDVRRHKAALSSGCKSHPANAPAGSNRSSHGGDEIAKPSECVSRTGDSASVQAVTRVNASRLARPASENLHKAQRRPFGLLGS
jgi:hypothetical protein